ncbi:TAXI family TRAP transporter solute-binding subunit [Nocardia sp. NPDC127579]|uniref:TAXI family TRAP transporter solute-binding subunit n=1 Tax=Nocardia sp. NPDC127579 TaxID=3345402 RepID=UPI003630CA11
MNRGTIGRRGFLVGAAASLLAAGCGPPDYTPRIRLGSGRSGGFFHEFAGLLAEAATAAKSIHIEPIETAGSQENLELLANGAIDVGLSLADSVATARTGALAIARLYETYIQLAVRADSPIRTLDDLRGQRIDLGTTGSGAAMIAERLLRVAGLDPASDLVTSNQQLSDGIRALRSGQVDAIVWGGGIPTPGVGVPTETRLIDIGDWVRPLQEQYGYDYDRVVIPANAYPGAPEVWTVGVPNLLLTASKLADAAVSAITALLLEQADSLISRQTLGFHFLDRRWLVGTGGVPLHPAAADYYRDNHG